MNLSIIPIEIKSGSDECNFRALPKIIADTNYHITFGYVFSNRKEVRIDGKIIYLPIYFIMFM